MSDLHLLDTHASYDSDSELLTLAYVLRQKPPDGEVRAYRALYQDTDLNWAAGLIVVRPVAAGLYLFECHRAAQGAHVSDASLRDAGEMAVWFGMSDGDTPWRRDAIHESFLGEWGKREAEARRQVDEQQRKLAIAKPGVRLQ